MSTTKKIDKYMGNIEKSALSTYKKNYSSVLKNMDKLKSILKKHSAEQKKEPTNWGYAGDLDYINNELSDIVKNFSF